jgi:tetratricopeptide (TPR) repeat protein
MARRKSRLPRRSSKEWAVRIALALLALVLGYFVVTRSLAQVLRTKVPEQAYRLAPYDGRITAYLSAKMSGPGSTAEERAESDRLARLALRQDPTAVAAVATLGINAQLRGDTEAARRYFEYSDKLSRRDLRTRLWFIEDAVAREDIPEALRHYDIALRTSRGAPDLLYPVLGAAISDATIRSELAKTLAAKPSWTESFVGYAAVNGDTVSVARLFQDLRRANVIISDPAQASVIGRLVTEENYTAAWSYYASVRPNTDRRRSRDTSFAVNLTAPSPFDWAPLGGDAGISTVIQSGNQDGIFDFSAPATVGGPLLQQLQLLPTGDYVIEGRTIDLDQADAARPYWVLICTNGRELGRVEVPNSSENGGVFRGRFTVNAGCPAQYLRLVARPSNAIGGLSGQIDEVQLRPAS